MGQFGLKAGIKTSARQKLNRVENMVIEAGKQSSVRLRNAGSVIKDTTSVVKDKLARNAIELGRAADTTWTNVKNIIPTRNMVAMDGVGNVRMPAENTHFFENNIMNRLGKTDGVSIGSMVEEVQETINHGKYSTHVDTEVIEIKKVDLGKDLANTFKDGVYRTVITNKEVTLYRAFGGKADAVGGFATTKLAKNRIDAKIDSALLPEWKNTRMYEAKIVVPKGEILNIGRVALQTIIETGTILIGDADQILLPRDWSIKWIKDIRTIPSK
ncbi:hypothetical protein CWR48_16350 [Oceanobacillus arenosus]|uniref:Uncharacterized protein n=1 Tax=Oceanobacillus arenosus TaxID=1229153 RepID=A0A3D8PK81_9BACI|nr:hypothetical protein CWR48_16350 [Oceanobacillus arenosus]